jgi:hypothetical protein
MFCHVVKKRTSGTRNQDYQVPQLARAPVNDPETEKRIGDLIAELEQKLREIDEQVMQDPNPFLPVIYSSTTLLLVASVWRLH